MGFNGSDHSTYWYIAVKIMASVGNSESSEPILTRNGKLQVSLSEIKATENHPKASVVKFMKLLGSKIRIQISDGRILIGNLYCIDYRKNVILIDTKEYRTRKNDPEKKFKPIERYIGMALIPGKHLVSFQVPTNVEQQLSTTSSE
jgi:small nuclear ribonucleoprotein (snRNP)-like protein